MGGDDVECIDDDAEISVYHDAQDPHVEDSIHDNDQSVKGAVSGSHGALDLSQAEHELAIQDQPVGSDRQQRQRQWNPNYRKPIEREPYSLRNRRCDSCELNECALLSEIEEPITYNAAINSDNAKEWKVAMQEEYDSLVKNNTWTLEKLPEGRSVIQKNGFIKLRRINVATLSDLRPA